MSATLGDMDRGYVANERGRKGRRFAANEMQASTVRAFARQRVQFGTRRAATASISGILARHAIDEALASTRSSRTITPLGLRSCRTWMPQRTPTDHANTIYQSPYALLGTRAHYTVGPGGLDTGQPAVFVEAGNLTGTTYASSQLVRDQAQSVPGPAHVRRRPLVHAGAGTDAPDWGDGRGVDGASRPRWQNGSSRERNPDGCAAGMDGPEGTGLTPLRESRRAGD
ncbi:hypothetical protein [Salinibacter sp.]|uniref:hypothetical protein n=1 Tax=Salinibacter sp. TaxID=2065818 RepID=UPI0021E84623|nr:hypothetical protein [Salinibacter sp.]